MGVLQCSMRKIVLVTGASSGLGHAVALDLSASGNVVYGGVRDVKKSQKDSNVSYIELDITSDTSVKKAIKTIVSTHKRIDALVHCAGTTLNGPTLEFTPKDYEDLLNTNTVGAFRLIKEIVPSMKKNGGTIITITSMNGVVSFPNFGLYSSSKFALDALSTALYFELQKEKIHFTSIAPGAIYNPAIKSSGMKHKPAREKFPILRMLLPMVTQETLVATIKSILTDTNPPSRIVVGRDAKLVYTMNRILPLSLWNKIMLFIWQR